MTSLPDDVRRLLAALFMQEFANPLHNNRMGKCEALWELAQNADVAVELGVFHGCGSITMALAGATVWGVDPYKPFTGWAGDTYGPYDEEVLWQACKTADVELNLLKYPSAEAVDLWDYGPVDLIHWDTATNDMMNDLERWGAKLRPGGIFAIHDTRNHRFGGDKVIETAVASGDYEKGPSFWTGFIDTLVKK